MLFLRIKVFGSSKKCSSCISGFLVLVKNALLVHQGFWYPPNEHIRIPVAIKILTDSTSPAHNDELLEEARIMASVHHEHCLRILAFCMGKQMMLITPLLPEGALLDYIRKNKAHIGSKSMLNWCVQIAEVSGVCLEF